MGEPSACNELRLLRMGMLAVTVTMALLRASFKPKSLTITQRLDNERYTCKQFRMLAYIIYSL
jgi:hypothetical protein